MEFDFIATHTCHLGSNEESPPPPCNPCQGLSESESKYILTLSFVKKNSQTFENILIYKGKFFKVTKLILKNIYMF